MRELGLEERQLISLNILKHIASVCNENGLDYYLAYGTLIGAVRHQGFIPWDDDIDIWVPYREYNKLLDSLKNKGKYEVLCKKYNDDYPLMFAKVSDPTTIVKSIKDNGKSFPRGIAVDVFPLADYPNNQFGRIRLKNLLLINKIYKFDRLGVYSESPLKKLLLNRCIQILNLIGGRRFWYKKVNMFIDRIPTSKFVIGLFSPYEVKDIHKKKNFDGTMTALFCGSEFKIPVGYDEILRNIYGNYMELPAEEKRISNHKVKVFSKV